MMSSIFTHVLQLLSIFTLFQLHCNGTEAYPITSKPIEWTAENWAWQAWAKQTSEEQSKGKGRKVTPKSIFETPYRNGCPPGHHADVNRCVPTVRIDPNELIYKQAEIAIFGDINIGNTNYDYGEESGTAIASGLGFEAMYNTYDESPKFSGESLPLPTGFDNAGQLPSQDAPLKFNFSEQKLSANENDTMQDNISYDEDYGLPAKSNTTTKSSLIPINKTEIIAEGITGFILKNNITVDKNVNNSLNSLNKNSTFGNITTLNRDLITESSNISTIISPNNTIKFSTSTNDFPIDDIDAISLSASLPMRHLTGTLTQEEIEKTPATTHKVSLHKGDSVVQLITTSTLLTEHEIPLMNKDEKLSQILKSDGILELLNGTISLTSSLLPLADIENSSTEATLDGLDIETTTNTAVSQEYENIGNEENSWKQKEKSDHTRSITESFLMSADDMSAQENDFTTTLEPDETTSFQLDDTTIIETINTPAIELQDLQLKAASGIKLEEHRLHENNVNVNVVKSKVQPVFETTTEASTLPLPLEILPYNHQFDSAIIIDGDLNIGDSVTENQLNYEGATATTTITTLNNSHETESSIIFDTMEGTKNNNYEEEKAEEEEASNSENKAIIIKTEIANTDEVLETSYTNNEGLSNIEMATVTISSDNKFNNNNVDENNKAKQALVKNPDDNNTNKNNVGEIVFVVESYNRNNTKRQPTGNIVSTTTVESSNESHTNENIETASVIKTSTERVTSQRWSKVMPIFDNKNNTWTTEQSVDDPIPSHIHKNISSENEEATDTPISSLISISDQRNENVNRRNSKIIRLDKYPLADSINRLGESSKMTLTATPLSASTPITTTKTIRMAVKDTIDKEISNSSRDFSNSNRSDPFWWLPMSWHLDRHEHFEGRPLLLRLWSTLTSNNQAKV